MSSASLPCLLKRFSNARRALLLRSRCGCWSESRRVLLQNIRALLNRAVFELSEGERLIFFFPSFFFSFF